MLAYMSISHYFTSLYSCFFYSVAAEKPSNIIFPSSWRSTSQHSVSSRPPVCFTFRPHSLSTSFSTMPSVTFVCSLIHTLLLQSFRFMFYIIRSILLSAVWCVHSPQHNCRRRLTGRVSIGSTIFSLTHLTPKRGALLDENNPFLFHSPFCSGGLSLSQDDCFLGMCNR